MKACWRRRPVGCLWALSARLDALPGRVVSGCCVALVSVVAGDDICVKVSTSCCECSVSVQDGNTFASVELLMPLHPATPVFVNGGRSGDTRSLGRSAIIWVSEFPKLRRQTTHLLSTRRVKALAWTTQYRFVIGITLVLGLHVPFEDEYS